MFSFWFQRLFRGVLLSMLLSNVVIFLHTKFLACNFSAHQHGVPVFSQNRIHLIVSFGVGLTVYHYIP